ncbi:hypothetical protein DEDE109153_06560 [Deinococcus deserti]|uniref:Uncharacterized protein n=1 Tax=Deinococcus deserti (strain DSM 17065 / CIP 109153 / LMG 22923 / VCD115) TaxID=546414 RepID=C1CZK7_DEIDV|nr:hypothetical protein [Deinococcus deserti]ACO47255.1 Conserved hypothetical protein, precursor [Deinococcus deserti VCD115]
MQKIGLYALLAIVVFALVFALLPVSRTESPTGATLQGVQLRLYPARDPDAVWSFRAAHVTSDPVTNETHLRTLSGGQRVVKERDNKGMLTGRETLDARLSAPELTIDAQDNMLTRQARITLVRECADIDLTGTPEQPVKIEQGSGFSAAVAKVDSPSMSGTVNRLRMSFQFVIEDSAEDSQMVLNFDATEQCINGKRVPVPSS